ncbi:hypothetical protein A2Z23_01115 [Candidatus Curtissbacteria bacterium RBG_16_39_7]|uniref:Membrane protein 6-pyruvoyl-tetrahydropterin synthase-related domain-containing protein n=1 Tax=Candidatus Curtissbacteria bacterium RBG_16_39_7 TaxID=1797707 RepID=A0A1F5G427_9BACT|nr:MAG: hypothetical protein A2Z23_01115 [Candidatus Curtissbacteria bacterium RBG_16_39_7]
MIFSPLVFLWTVLFLFSTKNFVRIAKLIVALFWGLSLAAFFSLPVLFEKQLVHVETLTIGYFNFLAHFADLNQLFISRFWGYGASTWGPEDGMSFQIGWLHWGMVVLAFFLLPIFFAKKRHLFWPTLFSFLVFWLVAFMTHLRSNFLWSKIEILQWLQFPWRFLALVIFCASFLSGAIFVFNKKLIFTIFAIVLVVAVIFLNQEFFRVEKRLYISDKEKFSGKDWQLQITAGIFDYLPKSAPKPPGKPPSGPVEVLRGEALIVNLASSSASLNFKVEAQKESEIRANIFDFPNWQVTIDGKEVSHQKDSELGRITFLVPAGTHQVFLKLENTKIRIFSNYLSLFAWLAVIFFFLAKLRNSLLSLPFRRKPRNRLKT